MHIFEKGPLQVPLFTWKKIPVSLKLNNNTIMNWQALHPWPENDITTSYIQ
jgi:hypothetical protein